MARGAAGVCSVQDRGYRGFRATLEAAMTPAMPAVYRPLHKYLAERYAESVVLQLAQIEDLINSKLPEDARFDAGWWANDDDAAGALQARSWLQAGRRASPNLAAGNVRFERITPSTSGTG